MENASKALIIAGAILLAILIITLGLLGYRQATGAIDNNAMDEVAITAFNNKFTQYVGDNVNGTRVNALIDAVIQNNVANQNDTGKQVKFKGERLSTGGNWQGTALTGTAKVCKSTNETGKAMSGKTFNVSYTTDSKTGLINIITIKGNS